MFRDIEIKNDEGYCTAWSIWFLDLRLKNPYISVDKLLTFALQKTRPNWISIRKMITDYTKYSFTVLRYLLVSLDIPLEKFVELFYSDNFNPKSEEYQRIFSLVLNEIYKMFEEVGL